jgi:F-type H+-transporting ATPase subunit b
MQIDAFTLIAQLVNFLVLVWLLKRFLYKPILNAIAEREKYIASQIQEADATKAIANKELDEYKRMNEAFAQQRQTLLNNAISEVDNERIRLLDELHNEVETMRQNYQEALHTEQQSLSSEIVHRTQTGVFEIARRTLSDLASVALEEQMTEAFLKRLKVLKPDERELLISNYNQAQKLVIVISSFTLSPPLQNRIATEIKIGFAIDPEIRFETDASLISGIAMIVGGFKVIWSIDEYLHSLKANLTGLIQEKYTASTIPKT